MSHNQLDLEYYDSGFEYEKGVVNDCGVIAYGGSVSVPFEDEADFSCFTVAFWMKWDGGEPGYWVMYAMAGKENPYHFEIYQY